MSNLFSKRWSSNSNSAKRNWADYSSDEDDVPSRKQSENFPSRKQSENIENPVAATTKKTAGPSLQKKDYDLIARIERFNDGEVFLSIFNVPYEYTDKKLKHFYQGFKISSVEVIKKGSFVIGFTGKEDSLDFIKNAIRQMGTREARVELCFIVL